MYTHVPVSIQRHKYIHIKRQNQSLTQEAEAGCFLSSKLARDIMQDSHTSHGLGEQGPKTGKDARVKPNTTDVNIIIIK